MGLRDCHNQQTALNCTIGPCLDHYQLDGYLSKNEATKKLVVKRSPVKYFFTNFEMFANRMKKIIRSSDTSSQTNDDSWRLSKQKFTK